MKRQIQTRGRSAKNLQRGFNLIELGVVMVIISILSFFAIRQFGDMKMSAQAQNDVKDMPIIVGKIQRAYMNSTTSAGVTMALLVNNNVFPSDYVSGANAINRWGGTVAVAAATLSTANDSIALTWPTVPSAACLEIIPSVQRIMNTITVAGTSVKANGAAVDLSALGTQCNSATNVSIVYTFTIK